ncbi:MAG: sodium-dependent transporter [Clostridia bacterium]|nr:sodium-dependent transporter [Clostridia bacterium]MBR0443845.1 sodium-dependent transporter [Clostridia bacterium]
MEKREHLGSRLGFIMLSAGCAIGVGNVWKFPWMTGQNGGGIFVLIYLICLLILGLPVMVAEFSIGRAAQASPIKMYQPLEPPGSKWHIHGWFMLLGNISLMAFYTVVAGQLLNFFCRYVVGAMKDMTYGAMSASPVQSVVFSFVIIAVCFGILSFNLQGGLERVTKVMMVLLLVLMVVLAIRSMTLPGAAAGLAFYLAPDFSKLTGKTIVSAMNQAFFTLSLGIGAMAIFGSYIGRDRALMGESVRIILLDTFVAITAGLIIFPACSTYGLDVGAGPSLLFDTMATVFANMAGGRFWGMLFFLFMVFAGASTVLAVFEMILACVRDLTGWSRPKGCLICGIGIFLLSLTTALSGSVIHFQPFYPGSGFLDFWDFIVSTNLLPLGSLVMILFISGKRYGWGWKAFKKEANAGKGMKVKDWMLPIVRFVVPAAILFIYIYGLVTFDWK